MLLASYSTILVFLSLHITIALGQAGLIGFLSSFGVAIEDCGTHIVFCNTPLEALLATFEDPNFDLDFLFNIVSDLFSTIFGLLIFNYPVMPTDGIPGMVILIIRMIAAVWVTVSALEVGKSLVARLTGFRGFGS